MHTEIIERIGFLTMFWDGCRKIPMYLFLPIAMGLLWGITGCQTIETPKTAQEQPMVETTMTTNTRFPTLDLGESRVERTSSVTTPVTLSPVKEYTSQSGDFAFVPPPGWEIATNERTGGVIMQPIHASQEQNTLHIRINVFPNSRLFEVAGQELSESDMEIDAVIDRFYKFTITNRQDIHVSGVTGRSFDMGNIPERENLHVHMVLARIDAQRWLEMSLETTTDDEKHVPQARTDFDQIVASLRVLGEKE